MFAIAVSSDAIARAVKMAAAAHLRRSAGRPSIATGPLAEIVSVAIRETLQYAGRSGGTGQPTGDSLHAGYASCPAWEGGPGNEFACQEGLRSPRPVKLCRCFRQSAA